MALKAAPTLAGIIQVSPRQESPVGAAGCTMTFRPLLSNAGVVKTGRKFLPYDRTIRFSKAQRSVTALVMLLLACQAAFGQQQPTDHFRPRIAVVDHTDGSGAPYATVTVDEQPAMMLQTPAGGVDPVQRAAVTAQRLQTVVDQPDATIDLAVQPVDANTWVVTIQGYSLVLVTAAEAKAHKTTAEALAISWQTTLQKLLTEAPIHPEQSEILVPVGENRTMRIGGAARASDIALEISDAEAASASFDPSTRTLTIKGNQPGQVALVLRSSIDGPAAAQVKVDVMNYAAQIAGSATVNITGSPAPPEVAERAFYMGLARAVSAEDGATVHLPTRPDFKWPLPEGHSTSITVPVRVDGPQLIPVSAKTVITLKNEHYELHKAATLLYSNDPEQVNGPQTLFAERIYPDIPVRLVYHHQNISNESLGFHVELENRQPAPMSVLIYAGVSLPGVDTIQVGRRAGAAFMNALSDGTGLVVSIPPYSAVPIVTQHLPSLSTVSGLLELHTVDGDGPVTVSIYTDDDDPPDPVSVLAANVIGESWSVAPPEALHERAKPTSDSSVAVFRWPHIDQDDEYDVGGSWTYLRLGNKDAIKDATGMSALDGNYGADYDFTLTLKNPGPIPRPVGLFFAPEAGTAAGCFRVDNGPIVEYDPTSPPDEPLLERYTLAPGETRVVKIWTIPLNGSYYPASIIVHAL